MTTTVGTNCTLPLADHIKIGRAPSVTRIAHPFAVALNHLLGYQLGGLRHMQRTFGLANADGTARVRTFRHPNCLHVDVLVEIVHIEGDWAFGVTAGSGDGQTVSGAAAVAPEGPGVYRVRAPWDASDADEQDVTVVCVNCAIKALAVVDVPRETLSYSSGDLCIERQDGDHPAIALLPERAIAASTEAGPGAIAARTDDAWESYRPQHLSWWEFEDNAREFTTTSYGGKSSASDIFPGLQIRFRARKKAVGDVRSTVTFWFYCWTSGASGTGQIQVTATNPGPGADDVQTSVSFAGTSKTWRSIDVEVDCTTEALITCEAKHSSGANTVYVTAAAAIGSA